MSKVILISIDGMRPDGFLTCGHPFAQEMMKLGSYSLKARTVYPSITLPCHMSLFHSVPPERHGILNNTYVPMVRPVTGLMEQLQHFGKRNAMFYAWEPLRNISQPDDLQYAEFQWSYAEENVDCYLTERALWRIRKSEPDFVFLYLVETDEKGGHDSGWMSETYLKCIYNAIDCVKKVYEAFGDTYRLIITADHGGHDRIHGTDLPEDMTIPQFYIGPEFTPGKQLENLSILDTAPTIAKLMDVPPCRDWEGKPVY